jgi:hypothetical protein
LQLKCHGDHRALTHAAGHFVPIGIEAAAGRRDLYLLEQIERPPARLMPRDALVPDNRLGNLIADRKDRI